MRLTALLLAGLVAWPAVAGGAETPQQEFEALGGCAGALGLYEGLLENNPNPDFADVMARVHAVEPRLKARTDALAASAGEAAATALAEKVMTEMSAEVAPLMGQPDAPTRILARYKDTMIACAVRGEALASIPTT